MYKHCVIKSSWQFYSEQNMRWTGPGILYGNRMAQ